jgi:UDP-N-acetylmuramoyl-tripeptide--D-alanyl-D-alanine ligase
VTAGELAAWSGSVVVGDPSVTASAVGADSRVVAPGTAFAAVRGGHEFTPEAISRGASFVIVEREEAVPGGATAVVTDDVVAALGRMARAVRAEASYKVVGVTGSYGKTLTKDFLSAALSTTFRTHATPASYNAELGVPLVVLSCPHDAEIAVVELGARRVGEIADLCQIVRPHAGVLTGVGVSHLELPDTEGDIHLERPEGDK